MNIQKMLKQAQEMQSKLGAVQTEMETREFDGKAGNGAVKLTLTGKGELTKITLDASLMTPDDKEMLEDLIIAAHRDAKDHAEGALAHAMGEATQGLKLPGGFKLPF